MKNKANLKTVHYKSKLKTNLFQFKLINFLDFQRLTIEYVLKHYKPINKCNIYFSHYNKIIIYLNKI